MKKKSTLRLATLSMMAVAGFGAYAAPIVVEAEDPIETFEAKEVSDWTDVEGCEASGKMGLGVDRAFKGGYLMYSVDAPEAGTYEMDVRYVTMNTRWIEVKINDQISHIVCCNDLTGGWNGVAGEEEDKEGNIIQRPGVGSTKVQVYLDKGENFMKVSALYGYSPEEERDQPYTPNLDCFVFTQAGEQIAKPADWFESDRMKFECESYDSASGKAGADERSGFSGARGGSLPQNSEPMTNTLSYKVSVAEEGAYKMTIYFATCQTRWIGVKVNQQVPSYLCFNDYTDDWNGDTGVNSYQKVVYLKKGANTITLGNYTKTGKWKSDHGDSPALDYFTIDRVSYPDMVEPEKEVTAYRMALSDIADWSGEGLDVSLINDHSEHTVATAAGNQASVTVEFPFAVFVSGYAWATDNNTSGWKVQLSNDGNNWVDAETPLSNSVKGNVTTYILPDATEGAGACKYVRLLVDGSETAALADFAVFGNPCESAECHVPAGMLPQGYDAYVTDQEGFVADPWNEGIEMIFDGFTNTQYTVRNEEMGDNDSFYVEVWTDDEFVLKSYMLSTHYSSSYYSSRSPRNWYLEAYDYDSDSYVAVDTQEGANFAVPGSTLFMDASSNEISSDGYRLTITGRKGLEATHLSALQLFDTEMVKNVDHSDIQDVAAADNTVAVSVNGNIVELGSVAPTAYSVYSLDGSTVAAGMVNGRTGVELNSGFYIVKLGNRSVKVIVK